jgi:hypothetical protein
MRMILIASASVLLVGAQASAGTNCTCRGPGVEATLGQTVCLKTATGLRLARCEMVLNNTSWKFLSDSCPEASRAVGNEVLAMSVAPDNALPLR